MTQNTNANPIYIPIVGELTEQQLIYIFMDNKLGNVKRVDFINTCGGGKGAFVHFNFWCNSFNANTLWHFLDSNGSHKFWFSDDKYLIIRKMICVPIPDSNTIMNVHQYAAKVAELEANVLEKDAKIADLETKLKEQNELNRGLQVSLLQRNKEDAEYWEDADTYSENENEAQFLPTSGIRSLMDAERSRRYMNEQQWSEHAKIDETLQESDRWSKQIEADFWAEAAKYEADIDYRREQEKDSDEEYDIELHF